MTVNNILVATISDYGAVSATGVGSTASATGYRATASATGDYGTASATGSFGVAIATGKNGAAIATGRNGKVSGAVGCALFLVERNEYWEIINVWSGIVGKNGIKPNTYYTLRDGEPVEADS